MKKKQVVLCLMLLLLSVSQIARGKPPLGITGPTTACLGDVQSFSVSPVVAGHFYYWSVTTGGTLVTGNPSNPATIHWVAVGPATVTVQEKDAAGAVVNTGTLPITVYAIPAPYITTDFRVACQSFDTTGDTTKQPRGHSAILDDKNGCPKVCEDSYVQYFAHSITGGGSTWLWTVTGGTITGGTTTSPSITVHWGPTGAGHISLTETNAGGCVGTSSVCIDIISKPHANFCIEPNTASVPLYLACLGSTLVFHDLSTIGTGSGIVSWHWDFGDGTISPLPNPTHAYSSVGTFHVTLVVTNECGCKDSFTSDVFIDQLRGPDIQCPAVVCENDTKTYSTTASGCSTYNWTVTGGTIISGAGTPSIQVQWGTGDASGYGYVTLDVGSGCGGFCSSPTTIKVPIIQSNPVVVRPTDPLCTNTPYQFAVPLWPSTRYHWGVVGHPGWIVSGDDNYIAAIKFPVAGVYTVHAWYENSLTYCGSDLKFTVTVMAPPSITGPLAICASATTTVSYGMSPSYTGDWTLTGPGGYTLTSPGTATFPGIFPVSGDYTLSVSGTTFCPPAPITIKVTDVPSPPNTISGPGTVCFGSPYTYSVTAPLAGTVFLWSVTPAGAATLSSTSGNDITVVWSAPGTISVVRESVADPHCQSTPLSIPVIQYLINPSITGDLVVCANSIHPYDDHYTLADATKWEIIPDGVGSVATGEYSPTNTILWNNVLVPTTATIKVTVKKCGLVVTTTLNVLVNPAPNVTLSVAPSPICNHYATTLTALPAGAGTYTFDFGDGTPPVSTSSNTYSHTYNVPHTSTSTMSFVASVTASGTAGSCPPTGTATFNVDIIPGPYASISTPDPLIWCSGTTPSVTFTSVVTNNIGSVTYAWHNSSGVIGSGTSITVSAADDYWLEITDGSGCTYISNIKHVVFVSCGGTGTCTGPSISMASSVGPCGHVSSTVTASGATSVAWSASSGHGGITAAGSSPTFTADMDYSEPGYYTVFAIATFPSGCKSFTSNTVMVPVIAHYYYDWDCTTSPYTLNLHDLSDVLAGAGTLTANWTVSGSGGGTSTLLNPSFGLSAGLHTITYTVTVAGVSCTITDAINVPAVTSVSFTPSATSICEGKPIDFPMTVTGGPLTDWLWDYGDGSNNSNVPGTRNYTYSITSPPFTSFAVNLSGHNAIGCPVSATGSVTIWNNNLAGDVVPPTYTACSGSVLLSYSPTSGGPISTYLWSNGPTTATQSVGVTGNYFVTVEDAHQCRFVTMPNKVAILNSTPPTIYGNSSYCTGETVMLGGYMGSGYTYQWLLAGTPISGATTYNLVLPSLAPGVYNFQLQVVTPLFMGITCTLTSAVYPVTIYSLPPAPVISGPTVISCPLYQLQLTASGVPGTFNWSSGTPGVGPVNVVDHGGAVRCWLTDVHGCVSHSDIIVPNSPESYKDWFPIGCYEFCKDMVGAGGITLYGPPGVFDLWDWMMSYSSVLSGTSSVVAPLPITGPGNYEFTLGNGLCTATFADMQVSETPCQCNPLISNATVICDPDPDHPHGYIVTVWIANPYSFPITVHLGTDIGPLTSFSLSLPTSAPLASYSFNLTTLAIPPPAATTIWAMYDVPWGQCYDRFTISPLPICSWVGEKQANNGGGQIGSKNATGMLVYPNPAGESVNVNYIYDTHEQASRHIVVYDAIGRKVADVQVADANGTVSIPLTNLAAGGYLVRMEENGHTVHVQHLSVTH